MLLWLSCAYNGLVGWLVGWLVGLNPCCSFPAWPGHESQRLLQRDHRAIGQLGRRSVGFGEKFGDKAVGQKEKP